MPGSAQREASTAVRLVFPLFFRDIKPPTIAAKASPNLTMRCAESKLKCLDGNGADHTFFFYLDKLMCHVQSCSLSYVLTSMLDTPSPRMTDLNGATRVAHRAERRGGARYIERRAPKAKCVSGFRRSRSGCLDRLHRSRKFRDKYSGGCEVWLRPALGRVAGQLDRDVVPGSVGQAWHRHRPKLGRDVPRRVSLAGRLGDVDRQRGRCHGDRSGRVSRRRHRASLLFSMPLLAGMVVTGGRNLRHLDVRTPWVPSARADHWQHGWHYRALLPYRDFHRSGRLELGSIPYGCCRS